MIQPIPEIKAKRIEMQAVATSLFVIKHPTKNPTHAITIINTTATSGELNSYLAEIDQQAQEQMEILVK